MEPLVCLCCQGTLGVEMESSRTCYAKPTLNFWEKLLLPEEGLDEGPEMNKPIPLCRPCAKQHHDDWDDMWKTLENGYL